VMTDRYYFFVARQKFDYKEDRFPETDLMYDRQERALFENVVYNDDFTDKRPVNMWSRRIESILINSEDIVFAEKLEAYQLVEAYREGKLKGKLKEIAAGLDEEDNPVVMIARNKR